MANKSEAGYHLQCSGPALQNVEKHQKDAPITLFGSSFCPFVHRAWVSLDYSQVKYKYYEVDPYKKPKELLDVSPRGLVPALRLNESSPPRSVAESSIIMEYIDELANSEGKPSLLPTDLYARTVARFQADHVNRHIIPSFYRYLQAQEADKQAEGAKEFVEGIQKLVEMFEKAEKDCPDAVGLWKEDGKLGWTDVMIVPWLFRATNVLKHYRGFEIPPGKRFQSYLTRLLEHPNVKNTCSTEDLYLDSYARYAENRPHTSQVADAVNSGKGLP